MGPLTKVGHDKLLRNLCCATSPLGTRTIFQVGEIKLVKPCFRAVLAWEGIFLCATVQNLEREGIDVEVVRTKL